MLRDYRTVRVVASVIANAGETAMEAYRAARVTDEPHMTDRLFGAIEHAVNSSGPLGGHVFVTGINWHAMTLRAGPRSAAHEKRFGADILGVLRVNLPQYRSAKGFLAQAKRAEPGHSFERKEWRRLQAQCERMLDKTPDSFVIIYSRKRGVRFVAAQAVASLIGRDLFSLYDIGIRAFFERHIQSFIGDRLLNEPRIEVLETLQSRMAVPKRPSAHVLQLRASITE